MASAKDASERKLQAETGVLGRLLARLRELRVAAGWTQEEFSERASISYKYYQAVEAGRKRELRLSTLERLARAHGLDVWELLAPTTSKPKPRVRAARRTSKQAP